MISLFFSNGKIFVWNAADVFTLRTDHRIVGSLVGSYPANPFQSHTKWLPLQLMPEEARLLIEKGIAQLVKRESRNSDYRQIESFQKMRDKLCDEQVSLLKENRKKQILEKADEIFEGKKRKLLEAHEKKKKKVSETPMEVGNASNEITDEKIASESESQEPLIDKDTIIQEELARVSEVSKDVCLVQLFTVNPWKNEPTKVTDWKYPESEREKLRYAVFKDLWEKKYYITGGLKFGGDFLAYEGDPLKFHALYIVVCKVATENFRSSEIVVYGRLGQQVKKTVVLASLSEDEKVDYISLSWIKSVT